MYYRYAEVTQLTAESEYLHAWAMAMNAVVQRVEEGAYVVKVGLVLTVCS